MLSVENKPIMLCRYAECHFSKCLGATHQCCPDSTVVEHTTHDSKSQGQNPTVNTERVNFEKSVLTLYLNA